MKKSNFPLAAMFFSSLLLAFGSPEHTEAKAEIPQGIYEISSAVNTNFVLDVRYCTFHEEDSHSLQLYHSLDVNQQKFYLESLFGGIYRINAVHSGEALTFEEPSSEEENTSSPVFTETVSHTDTVSEQKHQFWTFEETDDGFYYIRSRTGQYLTLTDHKAYPGASVELTDYTGKTRQKWQLSESWISTEDHADTDLINPYEENGVSSDLFLTVKIGAEKETLSSEEIASWMTETEDHELILNEEKLTAYVEKLAEKYNTKGHPRRFVTTGGSEITLYKGTYGWAMDIKETVQKIKEMITLSGMVIMEPVWDQKAAVYERGNDIGDSYVEISLSEQKVWLYIDGEQLLETDCVSGTYGTDRQTPGGVYFIYHRQSPAVLRGADYESPVTYWMPYNGGIGLHDANWRSQFGGDIFRSDGSHGCINLPTDAAKLIYESTSYGFPVVSYN